MEKLRVERNVVTQPVIHQLVYISAATHEFTEPELEELLAIARTNNEALGVTGMLLYHKGSFIQALEGPEAQVEQLYQRIGRDPRHRETRVLFRGDLAEREFGGWSMGFYRTAQSASENLAGFHRFLEAGFTRTVNDNRGSARKALLAFREGKWHQAADCA